MNCPICETKGLIENITICPQCDSDLTSFSLLKILKTEQENKDYLLSQSIANNNKIIQANIAQNKYKSKFWVGFVLIAFSVGICIGAFIGAFAKNL